MATCSKLSVALSFLLMGVCAATMAQQMVYKWVDEDGVVHFSEQPPNVPPGTKVETITTDPSPAPVPRYQPTVRPRVPTQPQAESQPAQPQAQMPPLAEQTRAERLKSPSLCRR